jgi:hypothetical protein
MMVSSVTKDLSIACTPRHCSTTKESANESLKDVIAGIDVTSVNTTRTPDYSNSSIKAQKSVVINAQLILTPKS